MTVAVSYCTRDVAMLNEIFSVGRYAPPVEVRRRLDAVESPGDHGPGCNIGLYGLYMPRTLGEFSSDGVRAGPHQR